MCYSGHKLKKNGKIARAYAYGIGHGKGVGLAFRFKVNGRLYKGDAGINSNSTALVGDSLTIIYGLANPGNCEAACDVLDEYKGVQ
jgi:hypothetical protein